MGSVYSSSHGSGNEHAEEDEKYGPINFLIFFIITWVYVFLGGYMEHKHVNNITINYHFNFLKEKQKRYINFYKFGIGN